MAIQTTVAASPVNQWNKARFTGFKNQKSGGGFIGNFKLLDSGDAVNMLFDGPRVNFTQINSLRVAVGLPAVNQLDNLVLPEVGDENMSGYDTPCEVFIKASKDGKYLNVTGIRAIQGEPGAYDPAPGLSGNDGVDDLPF